MSKSKTTDKTGRPVYPDWAQEILGKYRPHNVVVHHPYVAHPHPIHHGVYWPYHPYVKYPKVPSYKDFMNDKYYKALKNAADKARYHYAFDACQRKGKKWSAKKRYQCFKLMWKQYKPHKSNSLNAVRDRVQRDCMKYSDNPEMRKKCFQEHIKNYEDRLTGKKKKVASGLVEAENEEDNDLDEKNHDYEKAVNALNEDGEDEMDIDSDDNLIEEDDFLGEDEDNMDADDDEDNVNEDEDVAEEELDEEEELEKEDEEKKDEE